MNGTLVFSDKEPNSKTKMSTNDWQKLDGPKE